VAAGTLLTTREAKANHRDPGINVDFIHVHAGKGRAVDAVSESGDAVVGISMKNGAGVVGSTHYPQSEGVDGWNLADGTGVRGTGGTGVDGRGKRFGVRGNSNEGIGVSGEGGQTGVVGYGKTCAGVSARGAQIGGVFSAEKSGAQLLLVPGESRDRPTIGTTPGASYTWTRPGRCLCARTGATRACGGWFRQVPLDDSRTPLLRRAGATPPRPSLFLPLFTNDVEQEFSKVRTALVLC
jgi:hypothetical protein